MMERKKEGANIAGKYRHNIHRQMLTNVINTAFLNEKSLSIEYTEVKDNTTNIYNIIHEQDFLYIDDIITVFLVVYFCLDHCSLYCKQTQVKYFYIIFSKEDSNDKFPINFPLLIVGMKT